MARRPRLVATDVPLHIIQRGNNRQQCFSSDSDRLVFLDLLSKGANLAGCTIHAYVLMTNHVHILATPLRRESPGQMMKTVGERYVRYFNERYARTGTLWDGRYKSGLVGDDTYLLVCYRYIELNPVRAGLVDEPIAYRWSSYRANAVGLPDPLVTPHSAFAALGAGPGERGKAYRALVAEALSDHSLSSLRDATNHNYSCGELDAKHFAQMPDVQLVRRNANLVVSRNG